MQSQMSATCQELIVARKAMREKEVALANLKTEYAADKKSVLESSNSRIAELADVMEKSTKEYEEKIQKLKEESAAYEKKLAKAEEVARNYAKFKEESTTLQHEKSLLLSQLDKAHNDMVDLKVKVAEYERLAKNGEKAMAERDELKDECRWEINFHLTQFRKSQLPLKFVYVN